MARADIQSGGALPAIGLTSANKAASLNEAVDDVEGCIHFLFAHRLFRAHNGNFLRQQAGNHFQHDFGLFLDDAINDRSAVDLPPGVEFLNERFAELVS